MCRVLAVSVARMLGARPCVPRAPGPRAWAFGVECCSGHDVWRGQEAKASAAVLLDKCVLQSEPCACSEWLVMFDGDCVLEGAGGLSGCRATCSLACEQVYTWMAANIPRAASCTLLACFAAVGVSWCRAWFESAGTRCKWVGQHSVYVAAETGNLLCCAELLQVSTLRLQGIGGLRHRLCWCDPGLAGWG